MLYVDERAMGPGLFIHRFGPLGTADPPELEVPTGPPQGLGTSMAAGPDAFDVLRGDARSGDKEIYYHHVCRR